jgi:nucleoside-diphosphate-sugar epimerase
VIKYVLHPQRLCGDYMQERANMKVLVLGGNGATGIHVVKQLLDNGVTVKTVVRNPDRLKSLEHHERLEVITASILTMGCEQLSDVLNDVDAVVSCLGHNITVKGIWGKPHRVVTDAIRKVHDAIQTNAPTKKIRLVLMNTTACLDSDAKETHTVGERIVMALLRRLLPPHRDNEQAVDYLKRVIGKNDRYIEWVAVRPDTLLNEDEVTGYTVHASPTRSPIFNAGKTSRINVGNFMMRLLSENELWEQWKYRMPVVYNEAE